MTRPLYGMQNTSDDDDDDDDYDLDDDPTCIPCKTHRLSNPDESSTPTHALSVQRRLYRSSS
jgi:hypothetical protein